MRFQAFLTELSLSGEGLSLPLVIFTKGQGKDGRNHGNYGEDRFDRQRKQDYNKRTI